jgi:FtsP/CotA-like multicopper oxidase with cupredoxin domain
VLFLRKDDDMPKRIYCVLIVLLFPFVLSSTARAASASSAQPVGWDAAMKLAEAQDINPDPKIVEINLDARVADVDLGSRHVQAWTYDGGVPGPLIRAHIGDRLIVHFTNHLPDATTVHWHGVRVPISMDGVPGISQQEVGPGQSFTYDFTLPDAGLFWYHPHVQSAAQVGFGLSGPLLVESAGEDMGVTDELVLVLNDLDINPDGSLNSPDSGGTAAMAFGREGNTILVNGKVNPKISVRAGAPQRWRIVNTAKSRYFSVHSPGNGDFVKIGSDGGLLEYPVQTEILTLAPGERADVIVTPKGKPGAEVQVISELFNRGYGSVEFRTPENLFRITMANLPPHSAAPLPKVHRTIQPLNSAGATQVKMDIDVILNPRTHLNEYMINGRPFAKGRTFAAKVGETQIWTVNNRSDWSHPMHIHGFFFQVLDKNGEPVRPLEWKDTVSVPFKESLQLLVKFDDRPGDWMIHCHILDHAEGGLMTTIHLGDAPTKEHVHQP